MRQYEKPIVDRAGSLHELTLSTIFKTGAAGDVVVINGVSEPAPGGTVTGVS